MVRKVRTISPVWPGGDNLIVAIVATLRSSCIAQVIVAIAALIWLIPDRRDEERSFHVTGPSHWTPMTRAGHNGALKETMKQ
jgi:hypothetical protein